MLTASIKPQKPWDKPHPMARKCRYCGSQRPGMLPLRLWRDGKSERGYWHMECFKKARAELEE
jgi:hypothetical protein